MSTTPTIRLAPAPTSDLGDYIRAAALAMERFGREISARHLDDMADEIDAMAALLTAAQERADKPIDMILFCPACGLQHVDEPDERTEGWVNPAHRSHLCHGCGHIWRPADVATNGVREIATKGKADSPPISPQERERMDAELMREAADLVEAGYLRHAHSARVWCCNICEAEVSDDTMPNMRAADACNTLRHTPDCLVIKLRERADQLGGTD